jgi:hypothetical protein
LTQDNFIPVRVVGSQGLEEEIFIGDFPAGVVLTANTIQDVRNGQIIAHMVGKKTIGGTKLLWEVARMQKLFDRIFLQVMPQDAPVTVDLDGKKKRIY